MHLPTSRNGHQTTNHQRKKSTMTSADANSDRGGKGRQIPIVCPGHTRPLAELQFCYVKEEDRTFLVSACHGKPDCSNARCISGPLLKPFGVDSYGHYLYSLFFIF